MLLQHHGCRVRLRLGLQDTLCYKVLKHAQHCIKYFNQSPEIRVLSAGKGNEEWGENLETFRYTDNRLIDLVLISNTQSTVNVISNVILNAIPGAKHKPSNQKQNPVHFPRHTRLCIRREWRKVKLNNGKMRKAEFLAVS